MERGSFIAKSVDAGAELFEILGGPRNYIIVKFEIDTTDWFIVDCDVELDRKMSKTIDQK